MFLFLKSPSGSKLYIVSVVLMLHLPLRAKRENQSQHQD